MYGGTVSTWMTAFKIEPTERNSIGNDLQSLLEKLKRFTYILEKFVQNSVQCVTIFRDQTSI
jgi:hypothetical protein